MNIRAVALTCIVVTAIGVCYAVLIAVGVPDPAWGFVLRSLIHLGELAGVIALAASGAALGVLGRIGVGIAAVGQALFAIAEIVFESSPSVGEQLFNVAPLLAIVGMVLAGTAVLRSGRWSGWVRFAPLAVGLWMLLVTSPVLLLVGAPPEPAAVWTIAGWDLCWLLLGVGALTRTVRPQQEPAKATNN